MTTQKTILRRGSSAAKNFGVKMSSTAGDKQNQRIMQLMRVLLSLGLGCIGAGLYLLVFSDITQSQGMTGIAWIVGLLTLGLLLVIPAKVYIILRFTRRSGKAQKPKHKQ